MSTIYVPVTRYLYYFTYCLHILNVDLVSVFWYY